MTEQEQSRAQGAGESSRGGDADKGSQGRQAVASTIKEAAGQAKTAVESVAQEPAADLKTVLREAQKIIADEVKAGITQAASETLAPAARQAATSAMVYMTNKAPGLVSNVVKENVAPRLKEAGGAKAVAGTVLGKFPGLVTKFPQALAKGPAGAIGSMLARGTRGQAGGGEADLTGFGRGRRLPMQAAIDISVPVEVVYNQWTQFEEFPKFMFRVERIEQKDDTHLIWHEKIWGVRRQWEAEIVEQRPNERIVWKSTSGPQNVGVVNFHRLADPRLTRVQVNLDFQPTGLIEKTGSGWRAAIRALDTDLKRFKAFVEMKDAATGAWRGRVKDGEVEEGEQQQQQAEAQTEAPEGEQAEAQAEAPEGEQAEAAEAQAPERKAAPEGNAQVQAPSGGDAEGGEAQAPAEADEEAEEAEPVVAKRSRRKE